MSYSIAIVIWIVLLAAAIPYVMRIRHPEQRPLAAYLIFVVIFTAAVVVLFGVLSWLVAEFGWGPALEKPLPAALFLILVFGPSLLLARWQTRKPPIRMLPP